MREATDAEEVMINVRAEEVSRVVPGDEGSRGGGVNLLENLTLRVQKCLYSSASARWERTV